MNSTSPPRPQPVLIVTHGNGFFDVHGENINVNIVPMPFVGDPDATPLAEDFLEESLSPFWRKLFFPGLIRATGSMRPMTPSKLQEVKAVATLMQGLGDLQHVAQTEAPA